MNKQKKFYKAMQDGLTELGVVDSVKSSYPQQIQTKYGTLFIHVETEMSSKIYTCFTRFEDVEKAKEYVDCNIYSGKWNFHLWVKDNKPEEIAKIILDRIRKVT
jgi:hypothetical protein